MPRVRVYLKPFVDDLGSAYETGWTEITSDTMLSSLGSIRRQLDMSDYDIGVYTNSGISLQLRNGHGKYSDIGASSTVFKYRRAGSLVKVTWDQADGDYYAGSSLSNDFLDNEIQVFQGFLDDDATRMQLKSQMIDFKVFGFESAFDRALAPDWVATPPGDSLVSTLIEALLNSANDSLTTPLLTIDAGQINPANDVSWDDLEVFQNKTVKEVLNDLLLVSNSVLYLDDVTTPGETVPVVSARTAPVDVAYSFYGAGSTQAPENIIDIQDIRSGLNRTFNFVTWIDSNADTPVNISSIDASSVDRYGYRKKNITVDGLTTLATQQAIIDAIRVEFANPKEELTLTTPITSDLLAVLLLSRVDIDYPLVPVTTEDLPIYDVSEYGVAMYPINLSGIVISQDTPYKILGSEIDCIRNEATLALRRIA